MAPVQRVPAQNQEDNVLTRTADFSDVQKQREQCRDVSRNTQSAQSTKSFGYFLHICVGTSQER